VRIDQVVVHGLSGETASGITAGMERAISDVFAQGGDAETTLETRLPEAMIRALKSGERT
jgi:hypothetical protein